MELKEFIKETLVQISMGVLEAQNELKDTGCIINPLGFQTSSGNPIIKNGVSNDYRLIQQIKMSVAVNVTEQSGSKQGIGIVASIIQAGSNQAQEDINSKTNRIEFEIPISLPVMNQKK